jgi:hypothetical protein
MDRMEFLECSELSFGDTTGKFPSVTNNARLVFTVKMMKDAPRVNFSARFQLKLRTANAESIHH